VSAPGCRRGIERGGGARHACCGAQALVAAVAGGACEEVEQLDVAGGAGLSACRSTSARPSARAKVPTSGTTKGIASRVMESLRCRVRTGPNWVLGVVVFQPGARRNVTGLGAVAGLARDARRANNAW
jgi:hypothetical protein